MTDALIDDPRFRLIVQTLASGLYLGAFIAIFAFEYSWPHPGLLILAAIAVGAGFVLVVTLISQRRHPKRTALYAETNQWMRTGILPDTAPLDEALPRISRRIARNRTELWRLSLILAVYAGELILQLTEPPVTPETIAFFMLAANYGALALGWAIYYRIRWVPNLRQLLDQGQRRFTTSPEIHS